MSAMNTDSEQRLARLEERLAWLQKHVTEQDRAMLDMAEVLDRLKHDLRALRERSDSGPAPLGEERPPHY